MPLFRRDAPLCICCYGDSNTRYFFGDEQCDGPDGDSYPAQLGALFHAHSFSQVRVFNRGYPDMQTDFALAHVTENTDGADVCILGFGTNNIRQPDADLPRYLREFEGLLAHCRARGILPMALLIPWFSEDYAGPEAQRRLPEWNAALSALCAREGAHILDVSTLFACDPARFYNERRTAQRHYSAEACSVIARMAFAALAPRIR